MLAVGVPAALVMRHRPEQYGLRPDGDPSPAQSPDVSRASVGESRVHYSSEPEFTIRQALGTSAFWCLASSFAFRVMVTNAVQVHLAALLQDLGMSPFSAAGALGAVAGLSIIGRSGMGWLGDIFERRRIYLLALVLMVVGLLILAGAEQPWHVIPFLAIYAPAYGGLAALPGALRADFFGRRNFGTISGAMGPVTTVGTMVGPLFAGYVYDTTGSYRQAMLTFAVCGLVSLLLMILARRPEAPTRSALLGVPTRGENEGTA